MNLMARWTRTRRFSTTSGCTWQAIFTTTTARRSRRGGSNPDMGKPEESTDRRITGDRRSQYRPRMKFFLFGGRRKSARRDRDKKEFIYVDQYHPWLLVAILLLVILSISDAFLTLNLIERGATEKNPVMAYFLNSGVGPFIIAKLILTCSGILIILVFHKHFFRPLGIHVKVIIPASLAIFAVVVCWQIYLKYLIN